MEVTALAALLSRVPTSCQLYFLKGFSVGNMRVCSSAGKEITDLKQWAECVRKEHWKEGRSAYTLADFILNRNGSQFLEERISSVLSEPVKLEYATPEFHAKFDSYRGNPSNLDLGIWGPVGAKSSLFVGLEAKVDEQFGSGTVCQRYRSALNERIKNPRSRAVDRIEKLLSNYFSDESDPCASRFAEVGYQLLTGTAGTAAMHKDIAIFYVLVFKTHLYEEQKGRGNLADFENFIRAAESRVLIQGNGSFQAHEINVSGKPLVCIYDCFQMPGTG